MTNEELIDLLREARKHVDLTTGYFEVYNDNNLLSRIDSALAERQDSAKDVVEWTKGASEDDYTYAQLDSDTYVDVIQADGQWRWSALREQGCGGYCATEAEAKSAAIAAARGMR
jgi:hypothetical protein